MDWQDKLIHLYVSICRHYQKHLWIHSQRLSNNQTVTFTDQEVLTVYLFGIMQQHTSLKAIYIYTHDHLKAWFPHLPSYSGFIQRLNRLADVFAPLIEQVLKDRALSHVFHHVHLVDSMPIVMAQSARSGKARVAKQIASKGWCASKNMWYYGVKLHLLAQYRFQGLPKPDYIGLTGAAHHDLTALRPLLPFLPAGQLYGDRIYADQTLKDTLLKEQNLTFYTPVKRKKGQASLTEDEKRFSQKVSRIRQHIEGLFSWIDRKTNLSVASQVRSYNGLLVHVFGRVAAACFLLVFYS